MAAKTCASCGNSMIGRANARYCSATCRQRGHRSRKAENRDTDAVTVPSRADLPVMEAAPAGHCAEAVALLAALDAELAENAQQLGQRLKWSASEAAILELAADIIDRRAELRGLYEVTRDLKGKLKISAELRLVEGALGRLLRQIKTDLPTPPSLTSQKARRAAHVRWARDRNATGN